MAKKTTTNRAADKSAYALALARIGLGLIMLWAFFDKVFGLGFATCRDSKTQVVTVMCDVVKGSGPWIKGGSPTNGFLKFASTGPLADFYHGLAGNQIIDFAFMAGLLLVGIALVFGITTKLSTLGGSVLFLMMWSAVLPPQNNPVLDDHIIYIFALIAIYYATGNQKLGLSAWWNKLPIVRNVSILQ